MWVGPKQIDPLFSVERPKNMLIFSFYQEYAAHFFFLYIILYRLHRMVHDAACPYHKTLRGQETISTFPDPV